jgi:hypothetical protein
VSEEGKKMIGIKLSKDSDGSEESVKNQYKKLAQALNEMDVEIGRDGDLYISAGTAPYRVAFDNEANEPGWKVFRIQ